MIDFLRANTWCSQEEYKWQMTIPQIRLASMDFTHIEYLHDKEKKNGKHENAIVADKQRDFSMMSDLGIPIL
jgi:hypothetical protein